MEETTRFYLVLAAFWPCWDARQRVLFPSVTVRCGAGQAPTALDTQTAKASK